MVGILRSQQRQTRSVIANAIEVLKIRIAPLLSPARLEVNDTLFRIDLHHFRHYPIPRRHRILELASGQIVQVQMPPA